MAGPRPQRVREASRGARRPGRARARRRRPPRPTTRTPNPPYPPLKRLTPTVTLASRHEVTLAAVTDLATATNEHLANISNTLIYSAMAVYTLAFFAYIAEWLFGSRSKVGPHRRPRSPPSGKATARGPRGHRADRPAAPPSWSGPRSSPGPRPARGTCPTGPARTAGTSRATSTAGSRCPSPCSRGLVEVGRRARPRPVGAAGAVGQHVRVQHHLLHRGRRRVPGCCSRCGRTCAGSACPWSPRSCSTSASPSPSCTPRATSWSPRCTRTGCTSTSRPRSCAAPSSTWAPSARCCTCSRTRYENKLASGGKPGRFATSVMERLPASASLDKFSYRVNAAVFPLWTFTIIAGAIWAGDAWGRYWGWDPKETWAFITWVALRLLPARPRHGRLEGPQGRLHRPDRLRLLAVQLLRRQHLRRRQALLRGRVFDNSPAMTAGSP